MEEIFGLSMTTLMLVLLAIFLGAMAVVGVLAWRNRIMVKLGLRNIPRRRGQTVLIIIGVMLSTVIMAAAFGTGDTLSYSIRNEAIKVLKTIDEVIISTRADAGDSINTLTYIPYERFQQLQRETAGWEIIDGLTPVLEETVPAVNLRTSLSEGRMRVVALDPDLLQGFGGFGAFDLTSGEEARLEDLADNEVYITENGAEELDAVAGDEIRVFLGDGNLSLFVKGVVKPDGLAGIDSTLLISLEQAQAIFDRAGQINIIAVSNRGGVTDGAELSKEVTRELRVLFADREVASRLRGLLNQAGALKALEDNEVNLSEQDQEDISRLRKELQRDELSDQLISLLADDGVSDAVLDALDRAELKEVEREAVTLFAELAEFRVLEFKRRALNAADQAGSFVTTFFITFSLFSIMVGVLLIFLIFVMLAAARRPEMGMARAVGAKRRHIVQMFVFEGTAYALVSAAVGVLLGLGISAGMMVILNQIIASFDEDFRFTPHFEARSAIVAYCLGMVITFATVAVSAYRVSNLNIVAAIRGLPEAINIQGESPFLRRLLLILKALVRPLIFLWRTLRSLVRRRFMGALANLVLAVLWVVIFPVWITDVNVAVLRFVLPNLLRGWLTFLHGLALAILGIEVWERDSPFTAGVSLMIIGLGLMVRTVLRRTSMHPDLRDRIAFTFMGVVMLVFWVMPYDTLEPITGQLQGDFDMMFVSGIFMVTAAVWTIMYNTDLLLRAFNFVTGRIGKLRPVLVTAIAYPMSAKFRTGLTLAMFALVVFSLMVMSVLFESFAKSVTADVDTVWAGWDVEGRVNANTPIVDIHESIEERPDLRAEDFEAIGGFTWVRIQVRQVGAEDQEWNRLGLLGSNDDYLRAFDYKLKLIADGYGTTPEEVWQALRADPSLAVRGPAGAY